MEHETGDLIELEELDELVEEQERDNDEDEEFEHVEHESDLVLPDDEFDRDEECLLITINIYRLSFFIYYIIYVLSMTRLPRKTTRTR